MIRIHYNRQGLALTVSGHAGYAERGRDIVCAGVSTLIFALGRYLGNLERYDDTVLVYSSTPDNEKHIAAFDMALDGLYMTGESFGEYVEIINAAADKNSFEGTLPDENLT